jgi:hypothetical protein
VVGDGPQIEIIDTPPEGYTRVEWDNLSCGACLGCPDCEHICDRGEEERAERIRRHDESVEAALNGPGRHQLSDGSWVTVYRGPGDPDYPKGDGFDGKPFTARKLQIPANLPHVYPDDKS